MPTVLLLAVDARGAYGSVIVDLDGCQIDRRDRAGWGLNDPLLLPALLLLLLLLLLMASCLSTAMVSIIICGGTISGSVVISGSFPTYSVRTYGKETIFAGISEFIH